MNRSLITISQYAPAMLSGFLLTLAFPKADLHWLAWVALVPLILSLYKLNENRVPDDKKVFYAGNVFNGRKAFNAGFITGLCHFLSLIYWIIPTISIYGQLPLFLALPILLLLSSYLALYPALFAWGLSWLGATNIIKSASTKENNTNGYNRKKENRLKYLHSIFMPLTAASLWVSLEYIRSTFMTGFPWGLAGYSQYMHLNLIQIADVTSVYGISFVIVLTNGVLAKGVASIAFAKRLGTDVVIWLVCLVVIFGLLIGYGKMRIADINNEAYGSDSLNISVVQGNIEQVFKWDTAYQESTITKYCELSMQQVTRSVSQQSEQFKPDLIIWPETALPFYYSWNKKLSARVDNCIKDAETTFLIGSPAFKTVDEASKIYNFYNRAYMVNKLGIITASYDKVHLVPFGEYVPFGKYLSFLGKIIAQAGDFSSGKTDTAPLAFNGSSAGVLICFEVIFPYLARVSVQNGAQILVTMTNDAWFGYTSAPRQHFTMAVFRAIENRRAVARAANTGISGFIDPTGKILQVSGLFEDLALTQSVPSMKIKAFYSTFGDVFAFLCMFAISVVFVLNIAKKGGKQTVLNFPKNSSHKK